MVLILYFNNLCYVNTSNNVLDPATKIIVHFYTDFTAWFLTQTWLYPYPYGFCNLVRVNGMKINYMICTIWYVMIYDMILYDMIW